MAQVSKVLRKTNKGYVAYCFGCNKAHLFDSRWFLKDLEQPSSMPSLVVRELDPETGKEKVCHSYLIKGEWNYLEDCTHEFKGKKIPMIEVEKWY